MTLVCPKGGGEGGGGDGGGEDGGSEGGGSEGGALYTARLKVNVGSRVVVAPGWRETHRGTGVLGSGAGRGG